MTDQVQTKPATASERAMSLAQIQNRLQEVDTEADKLATRLENFSNYETKDGFDGNRFKRDEIRLGRLRDEAMRLRSQEMKAERQTSQWSDFAKRRAAEFLKARLINVSEDLKPKVQQAFLENFRSALEGGLFDDPQWQTEDGITTIIRDRYENALGRAYAQQLDAKKGNAEDGAPPRDPGLDDGNDQKRETQEESDPFEGDEEARNLFGMYEQSANRKNRTLADIQREQREAMMKKESKGEAAQGGDQR